MTHNRTRTALVTGASKGLGRALAEQLADDGWQVLVDARSKTELDELASSHPTITTVVGDLSDDWHRQALAAAAEDIGPIELLVNNASTLGPSPLPPLAKYPVEQLRDVFETNVLAPLALIQLLLPQLHRTNGVIVNISSDAATEAYSGWGGYGVSKATLDQLSAVLGAELSASQESSVAVYAFDPGDMRTAMHQLAFPGEDISDRPEPMTVVPSLLKLIGQRPANGRYRVGEFA